MLLHYYFPTWLVVWGFNEKGRLCQVQRKAFDCNQRLPTLHDRLIAADGGAPVGVDLN